MKYRVFQVVVVTLALVAPQAYALRTHRGPTSGTTQRQAAKATTAKKKTPAQIRGQRAIDANRAAQIQQALIQKGYLNGEPTGQWDSSTEAAMLRFQGDNGWQTKLTPDSRALIKLGLGPNTTAENESGPQTN
jgi:peptidoglycan hydrolase-like protein with peptidoglycan-binding domain